VSEEREARAHLIGDVANLGRAEIARVLRHTEKLRPDRLVKSVRERDHLAHSAAHALAAVLLEAKAPQAVWLDVASALALVSPRGSELLQQHFARAITPGAPGEDHVAHCLTDCTMMRARDAEPGWFPAEPASAEVEA
jgi:hypothetical protein